MAWRGLRTTPTLRFQSPQPARKRAQPSHEQQEADKPAQLKPLAPSSLVNKRGDQCPCKDDYQQSDGSAEGERETEMEAAGPSFSSGDSGST